MLISYNYIYNINDIILCIEVTIDQCSSTVHFENCISVIYNFFTSMLNVYNTSNFVVKMATRK